MADKIFVGAISPEGEQILKTYLNKFMPNAEIEPLTPSGVKGKIKNHAVKPDVALVIIDEDLYQTCVGVASNVLSLPKVHKYMNDDALNQFLISKFGENLVDSKLDTSPINEEDDFIPKQDFSKDADSPTPLPDQLINTSEPIMRSVSDDDNSSMIIAAEVIEESTDKDDIINDLRNKLAKSEMLVRNLTLQLDDNADDDDTSALVGRIRELEDLVAEKEKELESAQGDSYVNLGKVARAEQIIQDVDNLKAQLKEANEAKSVLEYDKNKLSGEVELLDAQVSELKTQIVEIGVLKQNIAELNEDLSSKSSDIEEKNSSISKLDEEVTSLESSLTEEKAKVDSLNEKLASLQSELNTSNSEVAKLTSELTEMSNLSLEQVDSLSRKISELEETNQGYSSKVAEIEQKIEELNTEIESKNSEIESLKTDIEEKKSEIAQLNESVLTAQDSKDITSEALDKAISEKKELEDKLVSCEEEKIALQNSVSEKDEELSKKAEEVIELQRVLESKEIEIATLNNNLIESKASNETVERLEGDLLEERRKSARLSSEIEVLKKNDDSNKTSELRMEIVNLRAELENAKKASSDSQELENLKADLTYMKDRCATLELDLVDRDEQLSELSKGVFGQMANIALPRIAYNLNVSVPDNLPDNFYCIASGSDESNVSLYQTLKRTCVTDSDKRILIVDLVTDSSIDRDFAISKIQSPIDWLFGARSYKEFVAPTGFKNVRVMSTALAYLNSLFLLQVDWKARLSELIGSADIVIINIGSLNNVVTKALFNSFSKVMKTYIIAKATPVNLRSTFLNMSGLKPIDRNVIIECVNFDDKTSKVMYQKLASEYNAQILKDTEILKL